MIGADLGPPLESGAVAVQRWLTQQQLPLLSASTEWLLGRTGWLAGCLSSPLGLILAPPVTTEHDDEVVLIFFMSRAASG